MHFFPQPNGQQISLFSHSLSVKQLSSLNSHVVIKSNENKSKILLRFFFKLFKYEPLMFGHCLTFEGSTGSRQCLPMPKQPLEHFMYINLNQFIFN